MKSKFLSTRGRIAFGLVCIHVGILVMARELNMLPDRRRDILDARATLCETVALVSQQDVEDLETILTAIVKRDDTVLSAGVRRADGELLVDAGGHGEQWQPVVYNPSSETQLQVPIRGELANWGVVEMRFTPLDPLRALQFLQDPFERFLVFAGCVEFLLVYLYLGKMLRRPKRSQASLGQFRSALDTLPVSLLVLDSQQRIILANQSMTSALGRTAEQLLGILVSELPWVQNDEEGAGTAYPWTRVQRGAIREASTTLRLRTEQDTSVTYMVNCRRIGDHNGKPNGVLVALVDVTQLKQQELDLRESTMEAELANHTESQFLARVSCEIFARR